MTFTQRLAETMTTLLTDTVLLHSFLGEELHIKTVLLANCTHIIKSKAAYSAEKHNR